MTKDKYVILISPGPMYDIIFAEVILFNTLKEAQKWINDLKYRFDMYDPDAFRIKLARPYKPEEDYVDYTRTPGRSYWPENEKEIPSEPMRKIHIPRSYTL